MQEAPRTSVRPTSTTWLLKFAFFAVLSVAFLLAVGARAQAAVAVHPDYTCPSAPSGWTNASMGPQFWGPDENAGADLMRITCWYVNGKTQDLTIAVNYALPDDLNPINDFYYGCGSSGSVAWNNSDRIYQVTSDDRWLYASVADPLNLISSSEVPAFEGVAKAMVKNAHELAHTCSLKTVPTATQGGWLFDFEFSLTGDGVTAFGGIGTHTPQHVAGIGTYAVPDASFTTKGAIGHLQIASMQVPPVKVTYVDHGKKHSLTLKVTKGKSFHYKTSKDGLATIASAVFAVKVSKSSVPGCKNGEEGTVGFGVGPNSFHLALCGKVFAGLKVHRPQVTIQRA